MTHHLRWFVLAALLGCLLLARAARGEPAPDPLTPTASDWVVECIECLPFTEQANVVTGDRYQIARLGGGGQYVNIGVDGLGELHVAFRD